MSRLPPPLPPKCVVVFVCVSVARGGCPGWVKGPGYRASLLHPRITHKHRPTSPPPKCGRGYGTLVLPIVALVEKNTLLMCVLLDHQRNLMAYHSAKGFNYHRLRYLNNFEYYIYVLCCTPLYSASVLGYVLVLVNFKAAFMTKRSWR